MQKRILFLINPISGIGKQKTIEKTIVKDNSLSDMIVDIQYTEYREHARELCENAVGKYDIIVAVGGDGTVNEVASSLIGTDTALGIIPVGSGNGLARFLNIPLKVNEAIKVICSAHTRKIDSLKINDLHSVNVSGIGFDAYISHLFAQSKKRGPLTYMRLITKEFPKYKSETYRVVADGEVADWSAFLISFANSSQYGNNVHIAPKAKVDDGLIDLCIIKDFPKYTAPALVLSLLDTNMDRSKFDVLRKAKNIVIEHDKDMLGHIDGEPVNFGNRVEVVINPLSLNVVVPKLVADDSLKSALRELIPNFSF